MSTNIASLESVADCEALLEMVNSEREEIVQALTVVTRKQLRLTTTARSASTWDTSGATTNCTGR